MFYSYKQQRPIDAIQLPDSIRLSNGLTRTDKNTFTEEELKDAGYVLVDAPPDVPDGHKIDWSGTDWILSKISFEEKEHYKQLAWDQVRATRNKMIGDIEWRLMRHTSERRMGKTPTDDILKIDMYVQALRDITKQSDPFNIKWPEEPNFKGTGA